MGSEENSGNGNLSLTFRLDALLGENTAITVLLENRVITARLG